MSTPRGNITSIIIIKNDGISNESYETKEALTCERETFKTGRSVQIDGVKNKNMREIE